MQWALYVKVEHMLYLSSCYPSPNSPGNRTLSSRRGTYPRGWERQNDLSSFIPHPDTRVGTCAQPRQSEDTLPQTSAIGTGKAGDPSQANQGAVLGFSVRAFQRGS